VFPAYHALKTLNKRMADRFFDDYQGLSKGIKEMSLFWEHGKCKSRKNARNSRTNTKYNATDSRTLRNHMECVDTSRKIIIHSMIVVIQTQQTIVAQDF
jgi:hypothetical protein